jgi:hypothetical protein
VDSKVQCSVAALAVSLIEANDNATLPTEPVDPAQELVPGHPTCHIGYFCPMARISRNRGCDLLPLGAAKAARKMPRRLS